MSQLIDIAERGYVPDSLVRMGIRRLVSTRLRQESQVNIEDPEHQHKLIASMDAAPIALHTSDANVQHYEVPARFFELCLGRQLKYSCCYWPQGVRDLDSAEEAMLALSAERAQLADGQQVLELGCGWGALTLWMGQHYPNSRIVAVSNSNPQREFIEAQARERGLENIEVLTRDMNEFDVDRRFDRIVSLEMFEHMRNWRRLLQRVQGWLKPEGRVFIHVFAHRRYTYFFETDSDADWMARHFFTGGMMPGLNLPDWVSGGLEVEERWRVNGRHYEKTANAWLERLDLNRARIGEVFRLSGCPDPERQLQRWRMFFMACAELFGFNDGREWLVAHYRLRAKE